MVVRGVFHNLRDGRMQGVIDEGTHHQSVRSLLARCRFEGTLKTKSTSPTLKKGSEKEDRQQEESERKKREHRKTPQAGLEKIPIDFRIRGT